MLSESGDVVSTGLRLDGKPVAFVADIPPFRLVDIEFRMIYTRSTPQGANVAPNQTRPGSTVTYMVGDKAQVYANEAAALIAAGIAETA